VIEVWPAGFWRRTVAWWADRLIGLALWALGAMWLVLGLWTARGLPRDLPGAAVLAGSVLLLAVALHIAYQIAFIGGCGQTPGQMMCGLAVVRRDGSPAGYARGTARSLAGLLTVLTLGLAAALVLFNRDRRGLGDLIAGTRLRRERHQSAGREEGCSGAHRGGATDAAGELRGSSPRRGHLQQLLGPGHRPGAGRGRGRLESGDRGPAPGAGGRQGVVDGPDHCRQPAPAEGGQGTRG
jgi:uncharacterized RDD family membrane protein YckC